MSRKLKNITLSADEELIAIARQRAKSLDLSLNDAFRDWLIQFTKPASTKDEYEALMSSMKGALSGESKRFNREKANER